MGNQINRPTADHGRFIRALGGLFYTLPLNQWNSLIKGQPTEQIHKVSPVDGLPGTYRLELVDTTAIVTRVTKEDLQEISEAYSVTIPQSLSGVDREAILQVIHHEACQRPTQPSLTQEEVQPQDTASSPSSPDDNWQSGEEENSEPENSPCEPPSGGWWKWIGQFLKRPEDEDEESYGQPSEDDGASPCKATDRSPPSARSGAKRSSLEGSEVKSAEIGGPKRQSSAEKGSESARTGSRQSIDRGEDEMPASVILKRRLRQSLAAGNPSFFNDLGFMASEENSRQQEESLSQGLENVARDKPKKRSKKSGIKSAGATPSSISRRLSPTSIRRTKALPTISEVISAELDTQGLPKSQDLSKSGKVVDRKHSDAYRALTDLQEEDPMVIPSEEPAKSARRKKPAPARTSVITPKRKRHCSIEEELPAEWDKYVLDSDEESQEPVTAWHKASPASQRKLRSSQRRAF